MTYSQIQLVQLQKNQTRCTKRQIRECIQLQPDFHTTTFRRKTVAVSEHTTAVIKRRRKHTGACVMELMTSQNPAAGDQSAGLACWFTWCTCRQAGSSKFCLISRTYCAWSLFRDRKGGRLICILPEACICKLCRSDKLDWKSQILSRVDLITKRWRLRPEWRFKDLRVVRDTVTLIQIYVLWSYDLQTMLSLLFYFIACHVQVQNF